ncbi:macrolide family glycosyltransferase [Paenibacillus mucilaginosus]|uniref:Glycosyltransferase, MGT n=1 Tax=Paenibacillus mucilaginosus (strain KNP414) TaxID=1036673 RepID=F8FP46_PAEMK|nr:macrolide family glycosyltransferase [Paenibacillus mucilaginosus]AEI45825.1 Glycosyltransferase, MGT [Paenibacillus mucilaginosus KNP414]MCG7214995.1 glycosyl transferase [Paenibacillus mucilaginosus]WDM27195.1 glycosyl transferase [Paenibacillus mucilaginosus]
MAHVLMINLPAEGHVNPTVGLVKELTARGERVTYYCTEDFKERLEGAGAVVRTYKNYHQELMGAGRPGAEGFDARQMMNFMLHGAELMVKGILPEVRQESYDYVIYDSMCVAGWIIADILGLPKVCSSTTFMIGEEMQERMPALMKERFQPDRDSELYLKSQEPVKRMEQEYGLDLSSLQSVPGIVSHPGDLSVVFTSRMFQIAGERFDDTHRFVGPSIAKRADSGDFPFDELEGHTVIYISLGTVFNEMKGFYQACFDAFRDAEAKVVLSVGRKINLEELPEPPANFIVRPYVPQLEVLQHADVFFTHGGMNSTSEGLYYGVPLAVLPVSADQPMVAGRVAEFGAGIALDHSKVTPELLRETAEKLLGEASYKGKAEQIAASFREAGGASRAAEDILSWSRTLQPQVPQG